MKYSPEALEVGVTVDEGVGVICPIDDVVVDIAAVDVVVCEGI